MRVSLDTDSRETALRLSMAHNERLEKYWEGLARNGERYSEHQYRAVVDRARTLGFSYEPVSTLSVGAIEEIIKRLLHVEEHKFNQHHVEAVLGGVSTPEILLGDILPRYLEFSKPQTLNKSPNQYRKWLNPRKKAMKNLIQCIGNIPLHKLSRDDLLRFRNWWVERIENDNLVASSANKEIVIVKTIIGTVVDNLGIDLDTVRLLRKLLIAKDNSTRRLPFTTEYLTSVLLKPETLSGLNEQARYCLYASAETGAGLNELTGLLPEDIILDAEIPHIWIRPRKGRSLKTKFRERKIPLVGFALDAFKACPNGFTTYRDRPYALSGCLSKFLLENKLLPSNQHTVYSLRHSFQDRLLAANTPDRVQADLMGHKFNRPAYGDGAKLEHKLEWMQKIRLKI